MKLNWFDMRHDWIADCGIGRLTPFFMQEVNPGEIWEGGSQILARLAPLEKPSYVELNMQFHIFYVRYRDVWEEFPEVWTGEDTSTPWPTVTYTSTNSDLIQSLGIAPISLQTPTLNALPIRVFNHIWNEHFRNPEEQAERTLDTFTGPMPQIHYPSSDYYGRITDTLAQATDETVTVTAGEWKVDDYREAVNRQRYSNRRTNYGSRYEDVLATEYGQVLPEIAIDKPIHCARGKGTMGISEVVATATSTSEETGEFKGHGITGVNIRFKKRRFKEPGMLMGVCYARPRMQLLNRIDHQWLVQSREDMHFPHLSHDEPEVVSSAEVYSDAATYTNFGYLPRDEWLRKPRDVIAGEMTQIAGIGYTWPVPLSTTPTVAILHQVPEFDDQFLHGSSNFVADIAMYCRHSIGKHSTVRKARKS